MSSFLISLGVGGGLLLIACLGLERYLDRRWSALCAFTLVTAVYLAVTARRWPGADVVTLQVALYGTIALTYSLLPRGGEKGPHRSRALGPLFIVAFFAVIVAVNVILVLLAEHGLPSGLASRVLPKPGAETEVTSRFPGTMTPGANKRQLLYDRHLQRLEEQAARGWRIEKGWIGEPVAGRPTVFQVRVLDGRGQPLRDATLRGSFLRPSDRSADRSFTMTEIREGIYRTEVSLPLAGSWQLLLRVEWGDEHHLMRGITAVNSAAADS